MDEKILSQSILFRGCAPADIPAMLRCLEAEERHYRRGEVVHHEGDVISTIGVVLEGSVSMEHDDIWGNKSILDRAGPGQVFAETYACVPGELMMISVVATEATRLLFLDMTRIMAIHDRSCPFYTTLIGNLLASASQKNLMLSRRILHTSAKSIRARLLSYLSYQAQVHGSPEFDIPFNRQQLADYLSVDRSALSSELGKMQRDGLLRVERSHFVLLTTHPQNSF